jgi:hypothetical protein
MSANNFVVVVAVVVAQGIQSFEIREIGVVVCSWQQSLTQSGV